MEKPDLYWVHDGAGTPSCHINDGTLNHEESKIGTIRQRSNGFAVILKDKTDITPKEGCPSLARAHMALESYARRVVLKKRG